MSAIDTTVRRTAAVAFLAWLVAATWLFVVRHDDAPADADAVVALAGSKTRLPRALELMREGRAPLLVVSLGSDARRERAVCGGRTRFRVVCFRARPYSTRGEARAIARIARERRLRSVDVVTSHFHVFRARIVVRRCFHGRVLMVGARQKWWKLPLDMVKESGKLAWQLTAARGC